MAKRRRKKRKARQQPARKTNWPLIIGVIVVGVIALGGLLYLGLQEPQRITLLERCAEEPASCVAFGEPDAPVTVIEVLDFGCTHCRDFHEQTAPLIKEAYVDTGDVQFIYFPYALSAQTEAATNASLCAREQDSYLAYADALFAQFGTPDGLARSGLLAAAETADLEMDAFTSCVDNGRYNDLVAENISIARRLRITSTPTFLINGQQINGALPFSAFQQQIDRFLTS